MKKITFFFFCLALCSTLYSQRTLIYAVRSGNWSVDSTWNLNRQPADNDSIVIPSGKIITLSSGKSLTNSVMDILGILSIDEAAINSNDLDFITTTTKTNFAVVRLFDSDSKILRGTDNNGTGRIRVKVNNSGIFIIKYTTGDKPLPGAATAYNNFSATFFKEPVVSLTVVLLEFSISNTDKTVYLKWKSQQENNYDRYLVERSRDGRAWQQIAVVKAIPNSTTPQQYSYTDASPFSGISYYRLRVVNHDGKFGITPVKAARISSLKTSISIYPNPAATSDTIFVNDEEAKDLSVQVFNRTGQLVGIQKSVNGSNVIVLDVSRWAQGDYSVDVVGANGYRKTLRIIVQRN